MSITYDVLGAAGRDNALFVRIDSGQALDRLLFDCGESCLHSLSFAEIQSIDPVFFSHFHMDHIAGFDTFFRCNFGRAELPNRIFGPPGTGAILQHRFQGYTWNLHKEMKTSWLIHDITATAIEARRYELAEAFAIAHDEGSWPRDGIVFETDNYTVEAMTMDHQTPSLAYVVREKPRLNVDVTRLKTLGLRPGPWLKQLKEAPASQQYLDVNGIQHPLDSLRKNLLVESAGDSIAYLTDFLMDEAAMTRLEQPLQGCKIMVCESQYRQADRELAQRNYHMTCTLAAELARRAKVGELVLFHLSDRYTPDVWQEMLQEARGIFPNTRFPESWAALPA